MEAETVTKDLEQFEVEATDGVPARPSMKERQRKLREEAILDAAEELLRKKGFNAMTLEDITEAIGISRPTLYQHFTSKEDVVVKVGIRSMREAIEFVSKKDSSRPAIDRVREFIQWSMTRRFGPESGAICELTSVLLTQGRQDALYSCCDGELSSMLIGLIRESQADGAVRSDIDAVLLMEMLRGIFKSPSLDRLIAEGLTTAEKIEDATMKLLVAFGSGKDD